MSSPLLRIQCPNPECLHPDNPLEQQLCDRCQTPLVHRYLWVVGEGSTQFPVSTVIGDRYAVISPQVWLDTQPALLPHVPTELPNAVLPYLHLYPYRLHLPELYGFHPQEDELPALLLLDNAPIDPAGRLYSRLDAAWTEVSAVRQVYWLWQMLQLWQPLKAQKVATSLLVLSNLRVEGWRVRLLELVADSAEAQSGEDDTGGWDSEESAFPLSAPPFVKDLAETWLAWVENSQPQIVEPLQAILSQMQTAGDTEAGLKAIATQLNRLLLEQTAQLPLNVKIAGATTTGPQRSHNEDACYPGPSQEQLSQTEDTLLPHVGIICDGIGGHEGGEVASQLALRSLQIQIRTLLGEFVSQTEPLAPAIVKEQLIEVVRVVNNLIAAQNDTQGRELRQRMGTTLVMALQIPQQVMTPTGWASSHELYLVHVGDSRAYWLTPRYCHLLTVDDDVTTREVSLGRSFYQEAIRRADAGALTQALGTRHADTLKITVQRFIIEENGLLLLCSDGLSDHGRVEQAWEQSTRQVLKGKLSLEDAVQAWVELANEQNGYDNTSVVILDCRVSSTVELPEFAEPVEPAEFAEPAEFVKSAETVEEFEPSAEAAPLADTNFNSDLTESSRALLYDEYDAAETETETTESVVMPPQKLEKPQNIWLTVVKLTAVAFIVGLMGVASWRLLDPVGFQQVWDKISRSSQSDSSPNP
jgi:protein phosphatase